MLLDLISEVNNIITCTHLDDLDPEYLNKFSNKPSFSIVFKTPGDDSIIINGVYPSVLKTIDIEWTDSSLADSIIIETSLDKINWTKIYEGQYYNKEREYSKEFIFLKITFKNHNADFSLKVLKVYVDIVYSSRELISQRVLDMFPAKILAEKGVISDITTTFLKMLEGYNEDIFKRTYGPIISENTSIFLAEKE